MTQPLRLALVITADGGQAKTEIDSVRTSVGSLGANVKAGDPFAPAVKGAKKAQDATKLAAHEVTNLSFQMNDMAMMLASGQSPFTVMMQQGMQVSQIMGSRGLGTVLPALAGSLASLVNPTMLALAAVTAFGYAASAVFSRMGDDARTADEALATHEAAIKGLKDAWGEAGKGVDDYVAGSVEVASFRAKAATRVLRSTFEREARNALSAFSFWTTSGDAAIGDVTATFNVAERFAPFKKEIEDLRRSIEAGQPAIREFIDGVVAIADADPSNKALQELALQILATSVNAERLALALPAAEKALDGAAVAAERAARAHEGYAGALERVNKAQSETEARAAAGAASHHARTIGEALKAAEELERRLIELEGRGAPVPSAATGTTPNREDVFAERDKRLEKTERAYGKVAGAIAEASARAQLEAALIGASLEMRNRATAAIEAEREIRARGLAAMGEEAEALRAEALALADLRTETAKSADAWGAFRSAGEGAVDGLVDKLADGDIKGALEGLANDIKRMTLQLGVANPIKNLLFGGDNPTFADLKSGGGLIGSLLGLKAPAADAVASAAGRVAATMHVTAATVIVNGGIGGGGGAGLGGGIGGLLGGGPAAAVNDNSVAGQAWNFFSAKGLKPHQIAGLMGNFAQESGFNPMAVGDGGTSFGLAQQHAGRAQALLRHLGGRGNLGDVGKQLDFIWSELQGGENAAFRRLLASTNVREATAAVAGYERPKGWSLDNPENAHGFTNRLAQAEAALAKYSGQTGRAGEALAGLGKDATTTASTLADAAGGLDAAGKAMKAAAAAFPAAPSAPGGGALSSLFRRGISDFALAAIGGHGPAVGLYESGGYTGDGGRKDVAGLVHRGEYVFDAAATRAIGPDNLEALRRGALKGYEAGGFVGPAAAASGPAASPGGVTINIIDNAGVAKREERARGADGSEIVRIVLDRVGAEIASGGYDGAMGRFGARPRKVIG